VVPGIIAGIGTAIAYRLQVVLPGIVTNPFAPMAPEVPLTRIGTAAVWFVGPDVPKVVAFVPMAYFDPCEPAYPNVAWVPTAAAAEEYEISAVKAPPVADIPAPFSS
jgi:hypothetical protein